MLYIMMLSDKGLSVDTCNANGDTILLLAGKLSIKDNLRLIQKLLELKADPTRRNSKGECFNSVLSEEALIQKEIISKSSGELTGIGFEGFWYFRFCIVLFVVFVPIVMAFVFGRR